MIKKINSVYNFWLIKYAICCFALTIHLTGCNLYKTPSISKVDVPIKFKNTLHTKNIKTNGKWWQNFKDEKLNKLINIASENNFDYLIALKNIQIAKTYISEHSSEFLPQVGLSFSPSRGSELISTKDITSNKNLVNLYQLNATVSYEFDVWNRIGNSVKQAQENVNTTIAESDIIRLSLISNVTNNYLQIATMSSQLENLEHQYILSSEIVKINSIQYKSDLINIESVDDAKIQFTNIEDDINILKKQQTVLLNTLAYMIGTYPEKWNLEIGKMPNIADLENVIPPAIPSRVMINRPDIKKAFHQVLSYGYAEKQSIASFFPTFDITGSYGFASNNLSNFVKDSNIAWSLGLNVVQVLFDYTKRLSQHKRAKLQYESAVLNYKNTITNAFNEVNNALVSYKQDSAVLESLKKITSITREKFNIIEAQYNSGFVDYITYLTYKLNLLRSEYNLLKQSQILLSDIVQVYKTLGIV